MISAISEKSDPNHGNVYLGYLRKFSEYNSKKIRYACTPDNKFDVIFYFNLSTSPPHWLSTEFFFRKQF